MGLRVSAEDEAQGLDVTQHGEEGYYWEISDGLITCCWKSKQDHNYEFVKANL